MKNKFYALLLVIELLSGNGCLKELNLDYELNQSLTSNTEYN